MKHYLRLLSLSALVFAVAPLYGQLIAHKWKAEWITHPTAPLREPIVLHFRRDFSLNTVPAHFPVDVSADNRFVLYVNGHRVGDGPARGDLNHWRYESFDLAPWLEKGKNRLRATVWNFGVFAALAQVTDHTAFLLEGQDEASVVSTGKDWQVEVEAGHSVLPRKPGYWVYMASGPGETWNAALYDWDWMSDASRGSWVEAASPMRDSIFPHSGQAHGAGDTGDVPWTLEEDSLPHMTYESTEAGHAVRSDLNRESGQGDFPLTVPAHRDVHILLDRGTLITAYPALTLSGGKDTRVVLTYSEALFDANQHKGDRNEVGNRVALGLKDEIRMDGGAHRRFETLWWRTWRYLDLEIVTQDEALTMDSLEAHATMYPFAERASFHSSNPDLDSIWEIGWRTTRLDAHETYMDTPYYEQLQYVGDTRIEAMISYGVSNDDRLARQAIKAFNDSRLPEGITASRYPSSLQQIIPTFSLQWVDMLHDYWMYRPDAEFVHQFLPGVRGVLDWFQSYEAPDHLLRKLPYWTFIDGDLGADTRPASGGNESCLTSLEYLGALDDAGELEEALGDSFFAQRDRARASALRSSLTRLCWDAQRGLLADTPAKTEFSQQGNILGVLHGVIPAQERKRVLERILSLEPGPVKDGMPAASYYFRYYLARALQSAGMEDRYLDSLHPWRVMLPLHFSTWPEYPGDSRTDSHAWSAHPTFDLLTLVAGVRPAAPGFARVRIAPHLGDLADLTAVYPHPRGDIRLTYHRTAKGLNCAITIPENLPAEFEWQGKVTRLHSGLNRFEVSDTEAKQ